MISLHLSDDFEDGVHFTGCHGRRLLRLRNGARRLDDLCHLNHLELEPRTTTSRPLCISSFEVRGSKIQNVLFCLGRARRLDQSMIVSHSTCKIIQNAKSYLRIPLLSPWLPGDGRSGRLRRETRTGPSGIGAPPVLVPVGFY